MVTSSSYTENCLEKNIANSPVPYGVGGILIQTGRVLTSLDYFKMLKFFGHQYLSFTNYNTQSANPGLKTVTYLMWCSGVVGHLLRWIKCLPHVMDYVRRFHVLSAVTIQHTQRLRGRNVHLSFLKGLLSGQDSVFTLPRCWQKE